MGQPEQEYSAHLRAQSGLSSSAQSAQRDADACWLRLRPTSTRTQTTASIFRGEGEAIDSWDRAEDGGKSRRIGGREICLLLGYL